MEVLIVAVLIGLIPAAIAQSKGRNFILWWFFGAAMFIIALPAALIMKADTAADERTKLSEGMKKCPFCAELIKREARVCRFCGRDLTQTGSRPLAPAFRDPVDEWEKKQKYSSQTAPPPRPSLQTAPCPHCNASINISGLRPGQYSCPKCKGPIEIE